MDKLDQVKWQQQKPTSMMNLNKDHLCQNHYKSSNDHNSSKGWSQRQHRNNNRQQNNMEIDEPYTVWSYGIQYQGGLTAWAGRLECFMILETVSRFQNLLWRPMMTVRWWCLCWSAAAHAPSCVLIGGNPAVYVKNGPWFFQCVLDEAVPSVLVFFFLFPQTVPHTEGFLQ